MYPMIDREKTGAHLRKLMKENHVTPADICEYLSLACVQTVYRWLSGGNIPSVDNLYALSQFFDVSMDELIVGNREPVSDTRCRVPTGGHMVQEDNALRSYHEAAVKEHSGRAFRRKPGLRRKSRFSYYCFQTVSIVAMP